MKKVIETEIYSAWEAVGLAWRRPDYFDVPLGLYALSIYGLERSRIMRASYLPIRKVDDVVDGDAPHIKNPLLYATDLRQKIKNNNLGKPPEEKLLRYAIDTLELKAKVDDDPRDDFIRAIDAILFDYYRSRERKLLTEDEIEKYYREAFDPVINITLLAIDSALRISDLPSLAWGQGRVYSARDFKQDWKRGLINVSKPIILAAGLTNNSPFEEVQKSSVIHDWFKSSLDKTKPDLLRAQNIILGLHEKQTQAVFGNLISPMLKMIEEY